MVHVMAECSQHDGQGLMRRDHGRLPRHHDESEGGMRHIAHMPEIVIWHTMIRGADLRQI